MEVKIKPIGFAKNQEQKHIGGWGEVITNLIIDKQYQDGLEGLSDYSHLIVVFWMHDVKTCDLRHIPQGKVGEVPEVGIFACRCPQRPNPIGISTAKILGIKDNVITVKGLDVIKDTPIIDIKPYIPQDDAVLNAKIPLWVNKLEH